MKQGPVAATGERRADHEHWTKILRRHAHGRTKGGGREACIWVQKDPRSLEGMVELTV